MKNLSFLLMTLCLFSTFAACSSVMVEENWGQFISNIAKGNSQTIAVLPGKIKAISHSITDPQAIELVEAISFALINKPLATLQATEEIGTSADTLVQRFDSGSICSVPAIMSYTKSSVLKYYALATEALKKAGKPAAECLNIMQAAMAEIQQEDERGEMKWGNKSFNPVRASG